MKISILGGSTTNFGELWDYSLSDLAKESIDGALVDARLEPRDIDALYVGNMLSGILSGQENLGAFFAEILGREIPAFHIEGACASGGLAIHTAIQSVLSGTYKTVMVLGIEKMTDHSQGETSECLMSASSEEERLSGATFAGLYSMMARAYLSKYKINEKELAEVAVKNHFHGSLNPKAQFRAEITKEKAQSSSLIADPLRLFDCSSISDGASAIIISRKQDKNAVSIVASEIASDSLGLSGRKSLTSLQSVISAAKKAYKEASILPKEVDVAEVHDCFSIAEVLGIEDLGFAPPGKALLDLGKKKFRIGSTGGPVINPSGGLKACGHPVGATGVKQIVEIAQQLKGDGKARQVADARIGLTHNVAGTGAAAVIHILKI